MSDGGSVMCVRCVCVVYVVYRVQCALSGAAAVCGECCAVCEGLGHWSHSTDGAVASSLPSP